MTKQEQRAQEIGDRPAFPAKHYLRPGENPSGMTYRDSLIVAALGGLAGNSAWIEMTKKVMGEAAVVMAGATLLAMAEQELASEGGQGDD